MSASVDEQIESLKELWLTDSDLSSLRQADPTLLAAIVAEARAHSERVQAGQRVLYETMARTTRFIPNFMLAKLSAGLSPYVLARVTEHLEPKSAGQLSKAYEPALLAEISLHLDARTVARIATHIPLETLVQITETQAKKGLSRRLGEVSDALEEGLLEKLVERIRDPERIAAVAAYMTSANKLASVARRLDTKLLDAVVRALQHRGQWRAAEALQR